MTRLRPWIFLCILLAGAVPCAAQQETNDVVVDVQTVPLQTLRLGDFDPIRPELAPVVVNIMVFNDDRARDLSLEIAARSEQFGLLLTASVHLGPVAPNAVISLTNRDFTDYQIENATDNLVEVALQRGVLPADMYSFEVRVFDLLPGRPRVELTADEGMIETSNPAALFDLLGPGVVFGQEPDVMASRFPVFQWISDAGLFDFTLYRVRPDQRSPEDVINSRPVFEAKGLTDTTFPYPNFAEELEPGATYAWQVKARFTTSSGEEARPSEVFWFTMEPAGESAASTDNEQSVAAPPFAGGTAARLEVEPQEIDLEPGTGFLFRVTAYDVNDQPLLTATPRWEVRPSSSGTIDANGLFMAAGKEGVAAVVARIGTVEDYATVFVQAAPLLETPALADLPPADRPDTLRTSVADAPAVDSLAEATAAADSLDIEISILLPTEDQQVLEPSPTFGWQVTGTDSVSTLLFQVSVWEAGATIQPVVIVPDTPPLWQGTFRGTTTLRYPAGGPPLDAGRFYVVRVDVLDPNGTVLVQSQPVRFTMAPQNKVGTELRAAWDNALRQGQLTLTLLAETRTPTLNPLDRQALLNTGTQIYLEDGPWLQLDVPITNLTGLVQLPFLRVLTLPAPPLLTNALEAPAPPLLTNALETPAPPVSAGQNAPVDVAVFEFGFAMDEIDALLAGRGVAVQTHSYRKDKQIEGSSPRAAAHAVTTVRALLDYLPPEATLHLINFETELQFRAALRYAVDTLGVRVASISVSWMNAYDDYDGTGYLFGPTLGDILGEGTVLVAAAGNFAQSHWEGAFDDPDGDHNHNFTNVQNDLALQLSSDQVYSFLLSWDDWAQPEVDLDLYLFDETGAQLYDFSGRPLQSTNRQGANQFERPLERIRSFAPPYPGTQTYRLQIRAHTLRANAPAPRFELYMYPWPEGGMPAAQPASSLADGFATAGAETVVPIAATAFPHSSQGPTNDGRMRPDFAADGVVRVGEVPASWPVGTSFAAPRVAAAFALVFSRHPTWTAQRATYFIRRFASDGDGEKTPEYGWGAIDFDRLRTALR